MVPTDNIFNIYYDIGRALPFEVQRFPKDATDWYKNQSVLVTEIHPRGKYGEAFGFYLQKGERADSYWCKKDETEPQLIPCCGCGGWSLVRVIGEPTVEAKEKKPTTVLEPDDILTFGKYKGRKVIDVYLENYQYLQWAEANVRDFLVNWQALMRVHREMRNQTAADNQTETSKLFSLPMIYVASSWRNKYYPEVIKRLRQEGFPVYDFRNPPHGGTGFHWTDVDENAPNWTFDEYEKGLSHPLAERQFAADLEALQQADTCVLVLPCGRSAHTEAGWMAGAGKRVIAYIPEMVEPELMYKLFDRVVDNLDDLVQCFCYDGEIREEKPLEGHHKFGLEPWVGENPKVLILGTMAGDTSIAAQAYYDDPRNPFWRLMGDIFQPSTEELSHGRKSYITGRGIALWDVIASGVRIDSSDASFSESTLQGNDIQAFLDEHPTIHTVVLNGIGKTYEYFRRFNQFNPRISYRGFHSTVSMIPYSKKLEEWSELKKMVIR